MASKDQSTLYEPIKELDIMLTQVTSEQMPFPGSEPYNTFRSCRNSHSFDVDNIRYITRSTDIYLLYESIKRHTRASTHNSKLSPKRYTGLSREVDKGREPERRTCEPGGDEEEERKTNRAIEEGSTPTARGLTYVEMWRLQTCINSRV
ncbi:hypothetical protein Bca4012_085373 [Brassica carinata]